MKNALHKFTLTGLLAVASLTISSAASANVIDFDVSDVPHFGNDENYSGPGSIHRHYSEQNDRYSTPDPAIPFVEWQERYVSEWEFSRYPDGYTDEAVLPELVGYDMAEVWVWRDANSGHTEFRSHLITRADPVVFDWAASWVEFDDGNRYSYQEIIDNPFAHNVSIAPTSNSFTLQWNWDESPLGTSIPVHVQFVYTPLSALPPAVPEPETYAMLLAGLGLVGIVARRRRHLTHR
jgi:hypothetical protein